jgi:hypothetical protein
MPAVVCPSCHSKLKAPPQLAGRRATCPRCRMAIVVPPDGRGLTPALQETKPYPKAPANPDSDTAESAAAEATAIDIPIGGRSPLESAEQSAAPARGRAGALLRAGLLILLAASGAFALWMASPGGNSGAQAPRPAPSTR